jgi:hypothetical protein
VGDRETVEGREGQTMKFLAAIVVVLLLLPSRLVAQSLVQGVTTTAAGATLTAAWDPNPASENVTGYHVAYGLVSGGPYTTTLDAGTATTLQLTGLEPGTTYFVVANAYTATGTSPWSTEVHATTALSTDPCLASRVTIVVEDWSLTVKVGDRGVIHFSLSGPLPIVETQVRLGTQVIGGEKGDKLITDLRDSAGLHFSVPRTVGPYDLTVATFDNRGCLVTTTAPRTVTVTP